MLRHANIETTQIYTHVSIDKLIAVHRATHPSRLQRHRDSGSPVTGPSLDEARQALTDAIEQEHGDDDV
jgi:integrase/recombinase XerD